MRSPAFLLTRVARLVERRLDDELPLSHYRILSMLGAGPERAGQVSRLLELSKPTVTEAVDALVARGLAERHHDATDGRAVTIKITAEGRRLVARVDQRLNSLLDDIVNCCDDPSAVRASLDDLSVAFDRFAQRRRTEQASR
ncbi:MAG: MarR family winged helix-turn-helix transcriptional regulator [Actinomycetota bacterium]